MTVREVLKRLNRDGWIVIRTRGDHRQLKHPDKPGKVTVAGHLGDVVQHLAASPTGGQAMRAYAVLYERGERNWSAYVPDLPGCVATGKTRGETERRIREAIEFHIEGLRMDGEPVPEPTVEAGTVSISA